MFCDCSKLLSLPDIPKWNISKVNDISFLFYNCTSLEVLPDISTWNTINVTNL